ncbi:hypothetical protein TrRE_jg5963 [Triparma retinervis]|uniref:Uncharacterized protein n=1 Tax=Triparma retinervis TaxID=2557542 RepID=A0A9W6ZAY9_9STRA|nr:hypothetical protein TrRE_jg5963 [Triparma retinervis]
MGDSGVRPCSTAGLKIYVIPSSLEYPCPLPHECHLSEIPKGTHVEIKNSTFESTTLIVSLGTSTTIKDTNFTSTLIVTTTTTTILNNYNISNSLLVDSTVTCNNTIGAASPPPSTSLSISLGSETSGSRNITIPRHSLTDIPSVYSAALRCNTTGASVPVSPSSPSPFAPYSTPSDPTYDVACISGTITHNTSPITSCTLHPNSTITNSVASLVSLCPSSTVSHSVVRSSYIMPHTTISDAALCVSSVIGPDSHLAAGETHCSLMGPCTAAHHQSLAISHMSPGGRTNMAAGTTVGAGCVVDAPFSLVTTKGESGKTEVRPGWVLYKSQYTVARAVGKFRTRARAEDHGWYSRGEVFRTGVLEGIRRQIEGGVGGGCRGVEVKGSDRGLDAYREVLKMKALEGALDRIEGGGTLDKEDLEGAENPLGTGGAKFAWEEPEDPWEYYRYLLGTLYGGGGELDLGMMMDTLVGLHLKFVKGVESSKKRDDERGRHITGYGEVHPKAETDKVVREWWGIHERLKERVKEVLKGKVAKL